MQSLSPGRRVLIPTHSGANFTTRCAARRPHVRGARSALGTEGGAQLPKEEIDLGKEGPEDKEERDSQAPEGLPFLKQYRRFLLYSAFTFTFSAEPLVLV